MSRKEDLLEKLVAGGLSPAEASELRDLVLQDDRVARMRLVASMGVGAAGALTLPALLDIDVGDLLDLRTQPRVVEMEPQPEAQPARRTAPGQSPPDYPAPESPEEEALEVAREANAPGQIGAGAMSEPREMGAPVRKVRAQRRR
jgi:hypothetical protein